MTGDYPLWVGGVTLLIAVGTWAALAAWSRAMRREQAEAQRILSAREAEQRARAEAERRATAALAASERRHRALTEAGAIVVWRAAPDGCIAAVEGWSTFTGQDPANVVGSADAWLGIVTPEDRGRVAAAWASAVALRATFDSEFRVAAAAGAARWCRARAVFASAAEEGPGVPPDTASPGGEWIGVIEDIDPRRRAEEARLLLAREVNHRAKNMLAVVQAVVRLTRAAEPEAYAAAVSARIAALGRAHDLLARREWGEVRLDDLAHGELAAYLAGAEPGRSRLCIGGPPVRIPAGVVQPLAIALHELAVNAAKYGALSRGYMGTVDLSWEELPAGGGLRITWAETGGPPLPAAPSHRGFGTKVVDASIGDQLGGEVTRHWPPEGLRCVITLPAARLAVAEEAKPQAAEQVV